MQINEEWVQAQVVNQVVISFCENQSFIDKVVALTVQEMRKEQVEELAKISKDIIAKVQKSLSTHGLESTSQQAEKLDKALAEKRDKLLKEGETRMVKVVTEYLDYTKLRESVERCLDRMVKQAFGEEAHRLAKEAMAAGRRHLFGEP